MDLTDFWIEFVSTTRATINDSWTLLFIFLGLFIAVSCFLFMSQGVVKYISLLFRKPRYRKFRGRTIP